ncbi:DUF4926 domain-containing protein [Rapidithrix thailandica]|uniref:DUF4926 domain-containing protein n=1 Tax=Rapidithrix thailandica TaxID=413964 RepID=A0AAW9S987_9BACT
MKQQPILSNQRVVLLKDIPARDLHKGQVGTIVKKLYSDVYKVKFDYTRSASIEMAVEQHDLLKLHYVSSSSTKEKEKA